MKILKNSEVPSAIIKRLREIVINDTKEVKYFLGVDSEDINRALPINKRDFEIWVALVQNEVVGFLTFEQEKEKEQYCFIKELYIAPNHRRHGYARELMNSLLREHPRICCQVNPPIDEENGRYNLEMYSLLQSLGLRGEISPIVAALLGKNYIPKWWSNYQDESVYINKKKLELKLSRVAKNT